MFSIVITERGGAQRQLDLDVPEISIGRLEDNDVVLPKSNVSKRHCRIVLKEDRYILVDLKSTNGTYVNGRKTSAPMVVRPGDKIYIGDFILTLVASRRAPRPDGPLRERLPTERVPALGPAEHGEPGLGAHPAEADMPPPPRRRSLPPPPPPESGARSSAPAPDLFERPGPSASVPAIPSQRPPPPPPTRRSDRPPRSVAPRSDPPSWPSTRPETPPPPMSEPLLTDKAPPPPDPLPELHDDQPLRAREPDPDPPPRRRPSMPPRVEDPASGQGPATSPAVLAPSVRLQGALHTLMERLGERMTIDRPEEGAFPSEHSHTLDGLIDDLADEGVIGPDLDRRFLQQAAISEAVGLGPLDRLLTNQAVREVVVDGPSRILADLGGGLGAVSSFFSSSEAVMTIAARLLARAGKKLDTGQRTQEGQLPDGSQVQLLLPPLSLHGPLISVRCPPKRPTSPEGLVTEGVLSIDMLGLLRRAARERLNVLVVGPSGGGVSTVLSALASLCLDHERVVTIEDSPSLSSAHPQVLPLRRRLGEGQIPELIRAAERLRYDRLVIDDVRGEDALAVLMAGASSRGLLLGMHAASEAAALEQLELFAQVAVGSGGGSLASLLGHALQLVVRVAPDREGSRRIQSISEIRGARGEQLSLAVLFRYDGSFRATDAQPSF